MSIAVEIDELRTQMEAFPDDAFLVTVGDDGRPHTVAVRPGWAGDELRVPAGRTSRANAQSRPLVSLLWPAVAGDEFSLIVDATVSACPEEAVVLAPTRAVLHRAAPSGTGSVCRTVL
jgi:hypothetical protein